MWGRVRLLFLDGNAESTTSARTQDEETGRAVQVAGSYEVLGDRRARQQAQEVDPPETSGNSPAGTAVETLERLAALHGRRIRLVQRAEAPIEVHAPRDLQVVGRRPCRIHLISANRQAIVGHAGVVEDLLSAFEYPWREFMLPCLRFLYRLRNPQQASIQHIGRGPVQLPDNLIHQIHAALTVGIGLPEFNDNRVSRILESTMDMPSLRAIQIRISNTGAGQVVPPHVWLELTHRGHSERWRLPYEVDRPTPGAHGLRK
ncbi:hypothetical protein MTO96_025888 [Rhipicephalus appendiculatus]